MVVVVVVVGMVVMVVVAGIAAALSPDALKNGGGLALKYLLEDVQVLEVDAFILVDVDVNREP